MQERQEKILLFNRKAKKDEFHEYLPITTPTQVKFTCRLCKTVVNCAHDRGNGVVGMSCSHMRKKCAENGFTAEKMKIAVRTSKRNQAYKKWNEKKKMMRKHIHLIW